MTAANFAAEYRTSLMKALDTIDFAKVQQAAQWLEEARDQDRQIFTCGNGGSAATASHFVTDMVKGASYGKVKRFRIMALTDSAPTMTAYGNDLSYDHVFVEHLKNFARPGDVVLAISGSGNSPNVLRAIEYGNEISCKTIGLSGRGGGRLGELAQLHINVAEPHMGRIEDGHHIICHMLCYYFMDTQ